MTGSVKFHQKFPDKKFGRDPQDVAIPVKRKLEESSQKLRGLRLVHRLGSKPQTIGYLKVFRIPPIKEHLEGSNISIEEAGQLTLPESWNSLPNGSSAIHGVRSRATRESISLPTKMKDSFSKIEVFPMLSPVMESELLRENWPQVVNSHRERTPQSNPAFWEENFQDLSDWCVEPQSINRFHIPPPLQGLRDYHIGEEIKSKNSGVKDNCDNLSYIKSELIENTGIGDNWTVEKNIDTAGMSLGGTLPAGQDQSNTVTDLSDVWLDLLPTTSGINEQHIVDSMKLISNGNENAPEPSLDLISKTIDTWLPNIKYDSFIAENQDDSIMDSYQSTSFNSNDDNDDNKELFQDILQIADVEPDSFDLLSYVCDEGGNILDRNNCVDKEVSTSEIPGTSRVDNTNKIKLRKERKSSQARAKAEPYIPPLKINLKRNNLSAKKISKQTDQESLNYTDSDSDTHNSDYSYRELRDKNNKASRKSRINKKVKETEMQKRANDLERDNAVLKMKVEELEKLVTAMRTALLQSALKKEI